jgi:hypothetical protein
MYVYRKVAGVALPHQADLQQRYGRPIDESQAQPGDLIVIRNGSYGSPRYFPPLSSPSGACPRLPSRIRRGPASEPLFARSTVSITTASSRPRATPLPFVSPSCHPF